jgi:CheY-like chemotaxis protein
LSTQVLVVDDESVTRRLVTHTLKTIGVEVIGAENGNEAIRLAQQHAFVMAIVDINLPDMDGFDVIRSMKAIPQMQSVPMIVFTARNHRGDEDLALEVGAVGFLYKPFSTQELRDLFTKYAG